MQQPIALPDLTSSATLVLDPEDRMTDDRYFDFCMANPEVSFERTAQGEIVIVPPAGMESDFRSSVPKGELKKFPHMVPEFVIEVMSPSDRLAAAEKKMCLWAANGVELGWLIDGDNRRVCICRGTEEPRVVGNAESVAGEGPVEGFVLPLGDIQEGL